MSKPGMVNLAFTGIATFAKFPMCTDIEELDADVAFLGIPWDEGVGYRPGARFGPRSIREYSTRFGFHERGIEQTGYYDINDERRYLSNVSFADCGDVDILYLDQGTTFERAQAMVQDIAARNALPVVLGGDHSVSLPAVRAMEASGPFDVVHIDAHLDFNDNIYGVRFANGNPFKRISELPFVRRIIQIGMRGIRTREDAYRDAKRTGNVIIPMSQIRRQGLEPVWQAFEALGERCYLSIDIDALDPAIAPGTGSPDPDGFQHWQVAEIAQTLAKRTQIVAFDLVEVNPLVDASGLTASVAAMIILETLGGIFANRRGTGERAGARP